MFSKFKKGITEKLMKRHEIQTCSVTCHNKAMYQVSVELCESVWEKKMEKSQVGQTDTWTDREQTCCPLW